MKWPLFEKFMNKVRPIYHELSNEDHNHPKVVFVWAGAPRLQLQQLRLPESAPAGAGRLELFDVHLFHRLVQLRLHLKCVEMT
jgi:hypothetical protein